MAAGKWGNHPSYTDPDVIYAEHMIQASWHLQKAGNAALAEACAVEAAKAFADVEPDRKPAESALAWHGTTPSASCATTGTCASPVRPST